MKTLLAALNAELAKRLSRVVKATDDDEPRLVALASRLEPEMRRRFLAAVERVTVDISLPDLEDAIRGGRVTDIEAVLRMERLAVALNEGLAPALSRGFLVGAEFAHQGLAASGLTLRFDLVNPHAVAWVREHGAELVTGVTQESRAAVRATIETAFTDGRDVRQTARALREVVGLTERAAVAVDAFRGRLLAQGVDAERVEARTARYAEAQLRYRATNIARSEIISASAEGQQSIWDIARTNGLLDPERTRRRVLVAMDERLCNVCEPLANTEWGLTEPVQTSLGPKMNPGFHASCRCAMSLVIS